LGGQLAGAEQRPVADDDQTLAHTVVQLSGDPFALLLLRSDQLAREGLLRSLHPAQLADAILVAEEQYPGDA
jgi:hypothetical protein